MIKPLFYKTYQIYRFFNDNAPIISAAGTVVFIIVGFGRFVVSLITYLLFNHVFWGGTLFLFAAAMMYAYFLFYKNNNGERIIREKPLIANNEKLTNYIVALTYIVGLFLLITEPFTSKYLVDLILKR